MSLLDDFKVYCRDKGKYNITDFNEILSLYSDFEADRKARKNFYEGEDAEAESQKLVESLESEDNDGYFSTLFSNLQK